MPCRTSVWSPRAPKAKANASSKIDLPAPVSPVSTEGRDKPGLGGVGKSAASAGNRLLEVSERLADPGPPVLGRLAAAGLHQRISTLVPDAVGEIVTEHGGRGQIGRAH